MVDCAGRLLPAAAPHADEPRRGREGRTAIRSDPREGATMTRHPARRLVPVFLLIAALATLTLSAADRWQATRAAAGSPLGGLRTVFVIVLENHNWADFKGSPAAPYLNGTLLPAGAHAEQYYNPPSLHPSLPNYLWLEAGDNFGVADDGWPSANHQATTAHLVAQLQAAGIPWKTYQEDIAGTACPLASSGLYAVKHNPFVYFDDVTNTNNASSANCIAHVRPYGELATDLSSGAVARYNFLTPNLCDDGHDSCAPLNDPVAQTDRWLQAHVPPI